MLNSMLADVVREGTGTQARVEGLTVYGKTGTAEVVEGYPCLVCRPYNSVF